MNILEDYPGAPIAVSLLERLNQWDMYRKTAEEEGIPSLIAKMKQSAMTALDQAIEAGDKKRAFVLKAALAEWEEPDFLSFVRAKLGAM